MEITYGIIYKRCWNILGGEGGLKIMMLQDIKREKLDKSGYRGGGFQKMLKNAGVFYGQPLWKSH